MLWKSVIDHVFRCSDKRHGVSAALLVVGALSIALATGSATAWAGQPCAGDINGDGVVDADDLGILLSNFGCTSQCQADLNGDGVVDADDLGILLSTFGCVAEIVPAYNRGIESLELSPGSGPGLWNVTAVWYVETNETEEPRDLSTLLVTTVNGKQVGEVFELATINAASGPCLGTFPPCSGDECGTWNFGFGTLNGFCLQSVASIIGINFCTCACVVVSVALEDFPLNDGDVVGVQLVPAPGSLLEIITGDDAIELPFELPSPFGACCVEQATIVGPLSWCINGSTVWECAELNGTFHPGAICADLECGQPKDLTLVREFEYDGKPKPLDLSDIPWSFFDITYKLDEHQPAPVIVVPVDPIWMPLPGNAGGVEVEPGGSVTLREPDAHDYLLVPPVFDGAIGVIEITIQQKGGGKVTRTCNQVGTRTVVQDSNFSGNGPRDVSFTFTLPPSTDQQAYCPIELKVEVQQFDAQLNDWVAAGPAEQPIQPGVVEPGESVTVGSTIAAGRRIIYITKCLAGQFGTKCDFSWQRD